MDWFLEAETFRAIVKLQGCQQREQIFSLEQFSPLFLDHARAKTMRLVLHIRLEGKQLICRPDLHRLAPLLEFILFADEAEKIRFFSRVMKRDRPRHVWQHHSIAAMAGIPDGRSRTAGETGEKSLRAFVDYLAQLNYPPPVLRSDKTTVVREEQG